MRVPSTVEPTRAPRTLSVPGDGVGALREDTLPCPTDPVGQGRDAMTVHRCWRARRRPQGGCRGEDIRRSRLHAERMDTLAHLASSRSRLVIATGATSRRCARAESTGALIRVHRHVFVERSHLEVGDQWEFARRARGVRALAVGELFRDAVISHSTALGLHGVEGPEFHPDIHISVPRRWNAAPLDLPELRVGRDRVPRGRIIRHLGKVPDAMVRNGILRVATPELAAVQCAFDSDPREGLVLVSGTLRLLSRFSRFEPGPSRHREERCRRRLLAIADVLPTRRHSRRAREVLMSADAGCESVPERILLWILTAAGVEDFETQMVVECSGRVFYVDFGIPGLMIVIEFDGKTKYGVEVQEVLESLSRRDARQKLIEAEGFTVVRFEYGELRDPEGVIRELRLRAGGRLGTRPVRVLQL